MSELTITVVRLGLLALLWVFVFSVVGVLRGDLFGTRVTARAAKPAPGRPIRNSSDLQPIRPSSRAGRLFTAFAAARATASTCGAAIRAAPIS